MTPEQQRAIETAALVRALAYIDRAAAEQQRPRRVRRALIAAANQATRRTRSFGWQWASWGALAAFPTGVPFTEEYRDWTDGRRAFEGHGDPDVHWRLTFRGVPVTRWLPRQWADQPEPTDPAMFA